MKCSDRNRYNNYGDRDNYSYDYNSRYARDYFNYDATMKYLEEKERKEEEM